MASRTILSAIFGCPSEASAACRASSARWAAVCAASFAALHSISSVLAIAWAAWAAASAFWTASAEAAACAAGAAPGFNDGERASPGDALCASSRRFLPERSIGVPGSASALREALISTASSREAASLVERNRRLSGPASGNAPVSPAITMIGMWGATSRAAWQAATASTEGSTRRSALAVCRCAATQLSCLARSPRTADIPAARSDAAVVSL